MLRAKWFEMRQHLKLLNISFVCELQIPRNPFGLGNSPDGGRAKVRKKSRGGLFAFWQREGLALGI